MPGVREILLKLSRREDLLQRVVGADDRLGHDVDAVARHHLVVGARIAQLRDGTRFLDTCSAETSDADCRFTIASLPQDTRDVGDLSGLRGKDIELRGMVHTVNDRSLMYLSDARQLHGGAEKFHPNPALLVGFGAEQSKAPVHDPSLSGNHHFSVFRATQ